MKFISVVEDLIDREGQSNIELGLEKDRVLI